MAGILAMALAAGAVSAEPAPPQTAACPAWTHSYTMHSSGTSSVILPTEDGGIILVGDLGKIDFGANIMVPDDWRVVAVRFDRCGKAQYAVPVGPKESAVEVATLEAEGSFYVAGASTSNRSWIAKVDRNGHQLWLTPYTSKHSGLIGLHPSGDGSVVLLANVSTGLTIGGRTFSDPETVDGTIIIPAVPFLFVIDADGRLTYSEDLDRHAKFLFQARDRFYVATRLGTGHAGSNYPNEVEARTNDGHKLWRRELEPIGQLAIHPKGGLLHFVDSYAPRCGWAWYNCPMEKRERVEINETGEIVSRVAVEGFGKTPLPPQIANRLRSGKRRTKTEVLSGGIVWDVDRNGYAVLRGFPAGYLVVDEQGRIVDAGAVPGLNPSRDQFVREEIRWAADGAAFALYFKSKNPMTFHLTKWTPRR